MLDALELIAGMPALCFDSYELVVELTTRGRAGNTDLADMLIGLVAVECECDTTMTFDRKLPSNGLFELV